MLVFLLQFIAMVALAYCITRLLDKLSETLLTRIMARRGKQKPKKRRLVTVVHTDGNNCPEFYVPEEHSHYPIIWCPWCGARAQAEYEVLERGR